MAANTINYKLVKPTDNEFADISVINANMDIIDTSLKGLEDDKESLLKCLIETTDDVSAINNALSGLKETSINISGATDYTVNRVRGISLTNVKPTSIPNGCLVGVYV